MASITKTLTEDNESSYRSTWTYVFTGENNIKASGSTFSVPTPVVTAKHSGQTKTRASSYINYLSVFIGSTEAYRDISYSQNECAWAQNVTKTLAKSPASCSFNTSTYFNSSNKTTRSLAISVKGSSSNSGYPRFFAETMRSNGQWNGLDKDSAVTLSIGTVTLDAPPTFSYTPLAVDTEGIYKNITTASVTISNLSAKYGGTITECKLTIGNQSVTRSNSGDLAIKLNAVGTFTPVVSVTDSRGQITSVNLDSITVSADADTTFDSTQVSADTPDFYTEATTASVTLSNIVVPYGGSVASTKLVIGNQETTGSGAGTLQIALDNVGTFTPVVSVTDSWGRTFSETLNDITVKEYFAPGISLDVDRATSSGTIDEESTTYILVTMPFTYTRDVATFLKPTLKVGLQEQNVTWYESWDNINGVSDPITSWTNYHPASPSTIYALVPGNYSLANTYDVYVTAHDSNGKDSEEITQKVPLAFFTMDFLAGGRGIAFGKLCTEEGFSCNMDARFADKAGVMRALFDFVRPVGSAYSTTDPNFDPNVSWGGTWEMLPEGYVLMSGSDAGSYVVGDDSGTSSGYKEYGSNTHTLTAAESGLPKHGHGFNHPKIPNHQHNIYYRNKTNIGSGTAGWWVTGTSATNNGNSNAIVVSSGGGGATYGGSVSDNNGFDASTAHSIMQKSIAVYWWIRTA